MMNQKRPLVPYGYDDSDSDSQEAPSPGGKRAHVAASREKSSKKKVNESVNGDKKEPVIVQVAESVFGDDVELVPTHVPESDYEEDEKEEDDPDYVEDSFVSTDSDQCSEEGENPMSDDQEELVPVEVAESLFGDEEESVPNEVAESAFVDDEELVPTHVPESDYEEEDDPDYVGEAVVSGDSDVESDSGSEESGDPLSDDQEEFVPTEVAESVFGDEADDQESVSEHSDGGDEDQEGSEVAESVFGDGDESGSEHVPDEIPESNVGGEAAEGAAGGVSDDEEASVAGEEAESFFADDQDESCSEHSDESAPNEAPESIGDSGLSEVFIFDRSGLPSDGVDSAAADDLEGSAENDVDEEGSVEEAEADDVNANSEVKENVRRQAQVQQPGDNALRSHMVVLKTFSIYQQETMIKEKYNGTLVMADLDRLKNGLKLNDSLIDVYMQLICKRSEEFPAEYPSVHAFSTFFYTAFQNWVLGRRTRDLSSFFGKAMKHPFENKFLLFPINNAKVHWKLIVVDVRNRLIVAFCSLGWNCSRELSAVENILLWMANKFDVTEFDTWKMETGHCPKQANNVDCGVFCCQFASYLISKMSCASVYPSWMRYYRQKMVNEILLGELQPL